MSAFIHLADALLARLKKSLTGNMMMNSTTNRMNLIVTSIYSLNLSIKSPAENLYLKL